MPLIRSGSIAAIGGIGSIYTTTCNHQLISGSGIASTTSSTTATGDYSTNSLKSIGKLATIRNCCLSSSVNDTIDEFTRGNIGDNSDIVADTLRSVSNVSIARRTNSLNRHKQPQSQQQQQQQICATIRPLRGCTMFRGSSYQHSDAQLSTDVNLDNEMDSSLWHSRCDLNNASMKCYRQQQQKPHHNNSLNNDQNPDIIMLNQTVALLSPSKSQQPQPNLHYHHYHQHQHHQHLHHCPTTKSASNNKQQPVVVTTSSSLPSSS